MLAGSAKYSSAPAASSAAAAAVRLISDELPGPLPARNARKVVLEIQNIEEKCHHRPQAKANIFYCVVMAQQQRTIQALQAELESLRRTER